MSLFKVDVVESDPMLLDSLLSMLDTAIQLDVEFQGHSDYEFDPSFMTDLYVLCYSQTSLRQCDRINEEFIEKVRTVRPNTPFILLPKTSLDNDYKPKTEQGVYVVNDQFDVPYLLEELLQNQ